MLYRIIIGVLLIVGLLVAIVLPANAEVFTYQDYISDIYVDGDTQIVELVFDDSFAENVWFSLYYYEDERFIHSDRGPFEFYVGSYDDDPNYVHDIRFGLFGEDSILSTDGIPDGTLFEFSFVIDGLDPVVGGTYAGIDGYPHGYVNYYSEDTDGEYVSQELKSLEAGFVLGDYIPSVRFSFFGSFGLDYTDEFGRSAKYDGISFSAGINKLTFEYEGGYSILCEDIKMTMTIEKFLDSELSNSDILMGQMRDQLIAQGKQLDELTGEVHDLNDKMDDLNDKVEELPGQIGDQMQDIVDQEKNEANSSGNSSVDDMIDIIPDYSTGLTEGVRKLASAMSYEGTECVLTMPALTIPALPGVTDQPVTFLAEQKVNFEDWFNRMPSAIMAVTKAFFDIAVVGYCFYEFYSLVNELTNGGKKLE